LQLMLLVLTTFLAHVHLSNSEGTLFYGCTITERQKEAMVSREYLPNHGVGLVFCQVLLGYRHFPPFLNVPTILLNVVLFLSYYKLFSVSVTRLLHTYDHTSNI
jgi:hypothetical protein